MPRWTQTAILGTALALSIGLIGPGPALADNVVLEGVVEGMGIVPCLQVDPTSGAERADALDVTLGRDAFITAFFQPPPDDSEPPPDDSHVMQAFGFGLGTSPVTRINALCGNARAPENTRVYPLEGASVRLPASCSEGMTWRVWFNDGSRLVLDLEVEGESGGRAVPPGIAVASNPRPEPGLPSHVQIEWTFEAVLDTATIAILRARLHPPEPGAPAGVEWK